MKKKILIAIILSFFTVSLSFSSNNITVQSLSVHLRDTARVMISMSNDVSVNGLNFTVQYNPALITFVNVQPLGKASLLTGSSAYQYASGKVSFLVYDQGGNNIPPSDTGSIFELTFTVKDSLPNDSTTQVVFLEGIAADSNLTIIPFTFESGTVTITDIQEQQPQNLPKTFALYQNYPNPFNPSTTIQFDLPKQSAVTLKIFNILGQLVEDLVENKIYQVGRHEESFNASTLASGIYFYRIEANGIAKSDQHFTQVKKMILLK